MLEHALALDMRDVVADQTEEVSPVGNLALRIGLHTGPVVAGVIGRRKFSYDLWGDAVNTAARMESHGVPGEIQLSEALSDRLRERFVVRSRGEIEVKGKGPMRTWLLVAERNPR